MKPNDVGIQSAWATWGALFIAVAGVMACCMIFSDLLTEFSWTRTIKILGIGYYSWVHLVLWRAGLRTSRNHKNRSNQGKEKEISNDSAPLEPLTTGIQSAWVAWGMLFISLVLSSACCFAVYEWFHEPSSREGRDAFSAGFLSLWMLYYGHVTRQYIRQSKNQPNQTEDNSILDNTEHPTSAVVSVHLLADGSAPPNAARESFGFGSG